MEVLVEFNIDMNDGSYIHFGLPIDEEDGSTAPFTSWLVENNVQSS